MKPVKLEFNVANDNGNSEHALRVEGELYTQPNIYSVDRPKRTSDKEPKDFVENLLKELYVTITSTAIENNGDYFIGERALNSKSIRTMRIDIDKHQQDLPIINTLGILSGIAVKKAYDKKKSVPESIDLTVDMVTALPIHEHTSEASKAFAKRFMNNTHSVNVWLGATYVTVNVKFEYVHVQQEGACAIYNLILTKDGKWRNDDIFDEFKIEYELDKFSGKDVYELKMTAGADIGEGTFDLAILKKYKQDADLSDGDTFGVGYAIDKALPQFRKQMKFRKLPKHQFVSYLKDVDSEWHEEAWAILKEHTDDQADQMIDFTEDVVWNNAMKQPKLLTVFGGGSIVFKDEMYEPLKNLMDGCKGKLLWIPEKYSTTMNVDGMDVVLSVMLPALKEKYLNSKASQTVMVD